LVMASRSGDVDPSVLPYLMRTEGLSDEDLDRLLNQQSGLKGLSGKSGDMQTLLDDDSEAGREAVELYCYRAAKYIGAYLAALGGADGIVFGGGVGENAAFVRHRILEHLAWTGTRVNIEANRAHAACITTADSVIQAGVVAVDESRILAEEALRVLEH